MSYDAYTKSAIELAVALANANFVNDLDVDSFICTHADYLPDLIDRSLSPAGRRSIVKTAKMIRETFRALTELEVVAQINTLLERYPLTPHLSLHDGPGTAHLHYHAKGAQAPEQYSVTATAGLAILVADDGWERLGVCDAASCTNVYVDLSRNRSKRFCSDACTNRETVAAYRARKRNSSRPDRAPSSRPRTLHLTDDTI